MFLDIARCEMDDAFGYYQKQMNGLGDDFIKEIMATINRIKLNPYAWTIFSERTRRCLVNRFPYGIISDQGKPNSDHCHCESAQEPRILEKPHVQIIKQLRRISL